MPLTFHRPSQNLCLFLTTCKLSRFSPGQEKSHFFYNHIYNYLLFHMQIMNLSRFIKKVSFTACHLDKLYLACASPIDTLTRPKRIFNEQDWLQLSKGSFEGCLSTEESPLPLYYTVCHVTVLNLDHLLSVIRVKERLALPENLVKTTAQKLLCFI